VSLSPSRRAAPPHASVVAEGREAIALAMRVLVVEDEAMIAWMMESLLQDMGFSDIVVVSSGEDAVEMATDLLPGLILSDINLGTAGMDGVEAVMSIAQRGVVPTLFISGYASEETRDRIRRQVPGAGVPRKPVDAETLRLAVTRVLSVSGRN